MDMIFENQIIIIIIITIFYSWVFHTSARGGPSIESEWQQLSTIYQHSSQYSGRF